MHKLLIINVLYVLQLYFFTINRLLHSHYLQLILELC